MRKPDWSKQAERMWNLFKENPNKDIPAPALDRAAAGDGNYIASRSKRISECRVRAKILGYDLLKSRDEWSNGKRFTHYRLVVP